MREALDGFVIRGISEQHPVPGGAARASEVRQRRLQHRLHRRALRQGLPCRGRAARRPGLPGRAGRLRASALPRARLGHQRPARGPWREGRRAVRRGLLDAKGGHVHKPVSVTDFHGRAGSSAVSVDGKSYKIDHQGGARQRACATATSTAAPSPRRSNAGAGKNPLALRVAHDGTQIEAMVLSPLGAPSSPG